MGRVRGSRRSVLFIFSSNRPDPLGPKPLLCILKCSQVVHTAPTIFSQTKKSDSSCASCASSAGRPVTVRVRGVTVRVRGPVRVRGQRSDSSNALNARKVSRGNKIISFCLPSAVV